MLIEFSVKNFMSIKDEITFSMLAGTGNENTQNVIINENIDEQYLKVGAIYGANASGKTNLVKAISTAIMMVRKSNSRNINEKLLQMIPFKFDVETVNKPCEFKFIFLKNDIKYVYGFSADINKVYTEYLYHYLSAKPSMIFERNNTNEYKFTKAENSKLQELATKNTENKLFLSTATAWNYEKTKDPFMWFAEDINTFYEYKDIAGYAFYKFENDNKGSLKDFTINLLKQADMYIKDYSLEIENVDLNNSGDSEYKGRNERVLQKKIRVSTFHEIEKEDGNKENYQLNLREESLGTQNLFFLSPILKEAFEKGKIIVVDEIDKSMHPLLVEYIIRLFHNKEINKNNAQLIFNTHDTNLLSLDIFRREQIWFTEKNSKSGSTDLYPLDDFSVRKTENIQKGYLNGRYGAIPFLVMGDDLWKD